MENGWTIFQTIFKKTWNLYGESNFAFIACRFYGLLKHSKTFQQMMGKAYGFFFALSKDFYRIDSFFRHYYEAGLFPNYMMESIDGQMVSLMISSGSRGKTSRYRNTKDIGYCFFCEILTKTKPIISEAI